MTSGTLVAIVAVGMLCGMDLVTVPQMMIARPLVAGGLGGLVVGAPLPGLAMGALLELFAMESLPVGAARYPDWGPPAVAAGAMVGASRASASASGLLAVILVSIAVAWLGGALMHMVRRANIATVHARQAALDAGDVRALRFVHWAGVGRDAARAAFLAILAVFLDDLVSVWFAGTWHGPQRLAQLAIGVVTIGVGAWSAWRLFGHGRAKWWLAAGLAAGAVTMVVVR